MALQFLCTSKNHEKIYVDKVNSHAATHLQENPQLESFVKKVLSTTDITGQEVAFEKDMGKVVGNIDLVATEEGDEIVYAKRINRNTYTRFVKNKQPTTTSLLTIILKKREDHTYELWSAYAGILVPPLPGDERETPESKPFWSIHALIWGTQAIQPGTERKEIPW